MSLMPVKTAISDVYPNPDNATANAGFGAFWTAMYEATEKPELDVASAATVNIGGQLSTKLRITGTTGPITSFGTTYRGPILIRFAGAVPITHNATTLILPGGANLTTRAGSTMIAYPKATAGTADGWIVAFSSDGAIALGQLSAAAANSGYPQSGTGGETLRTIRGNISIATAITAGSGFAVSKTGTGVYQITFTTPFSAKPSITLSVFALGCQMSLNGEPSVSTATVLIANSAGTGIDAAFNFIATGPA